MTNLKSAARQLVRLPVLSAVIIIMLALGIGATTGIYSLFHQILVEPLPVPAPDELVYIRETGPKVGSLWCGAGICDLEYAFSYPTFRDLEARQTVFDGIAAYFGGFEANLASPDQTASGWGVLVSGSYFSVLKLSPALGRLIGPHDEPRVGESGVAVLSYDYWQSHFGGANDVVGRTLTVNEQTLTIIGVAPRGFAGTAIDIRPKIFVPLTLRWLMQPEALQLQGDADNRFGPFLNVLARLKPDTSVEQATAALNAMYAVMLEEEISLNPFQSAEEVRQRRLVLEPGAKGQSSFPEGAARPLTLLLGITVLVLLIVCANVANLLLARGASRASEMAIRKTMGATQGRLVRQLLTEVSLLAVIGIAVSLPVALIVLRLIVAMLPAERADVFATQMNSSAVIVAAGASLATVLMFGLFPALLASRAEVGVPIKGRTAQSSAGRSTVRVRGLLTTAQIALSMVLLVLAGLFAQSLTNIARVDLGMNVDSVVHFRVNPRLSGYEGERTAALHERLLAELAAQPGVTSVASASVPVVTGAGLRDEIRADGFEGVPGDERVARRNDVSPGFFELLSVPLLAGRAFAVQDRDSPVAIVNESFTRKFNLGVGGEAIGKRFGFSGSPEGGVEIVGVVADAQYREIKEAIPPQFFLPHRPEVDAFISWVHFYARVNIDTDALMRSIPRVVSSVAAGLPVNDLTTARRHVRDNVYVDRMITMLSIVFAGLATLLAAVGLYAVLSCGVTQRTRELGLRLALGAEPRRLRAMVLKQVGTMALIGGAIGVAAAIGLGRAVEAMLFGVSGYEPVVLVAAASVLGAVVLAASYIPARRASSIAPMEALRYE